jgi:hypothetical protein
MLVASGAFEGLEFGIPLLDSLPHPAAEAAAAPIAIAGDG